MRFGGHVFGYEDNVTSLINKVKEKGFSTFYYPKFALKMNDEELYNFKETIRKENLVLAEVGAWSNPLSPDKAVAEAAREKIISRLILAEKLEACDVVNIVGSANPNGLCSYAAENFSQPFIDRAAAFYRSVLDEVPLRKTTLSFEMSPFNFLNSMDAYLDFMDRINRPGLSVHLDFTNLITNPEELAHHLEIIENNLKKCEFQVSSIHFKDLILRDDTMNTEMIEVPVGEGQMELERIMELCERCGGEVPVLLEHYKEEATYDLAAKNFRAIAEKAGIRIL